MPIAKERHNLKTTEPVYVVITPLPFTGKREGVRFFEGEGRTKHREKAQRFDELFNYTVILPKGAKPWVNATGDGPVGVDTDDESNPFTEDGATNDDSYGETSEE